MVRLIIKFIVTSVFDRALLKLFLLTSIHIMVFISCSSPTEPIISLDDNYFENFWGQLESDLANAILKTDGSVWTWGINDSGQLGDGTTISREEPKLIKSLTNIVAIDLAEGAAVAADIEGNIWFWGDRLIWNEGSYDTVVTVPKKISHLSGVISLEMYSIYINLLRIDGSVWRLQWDHRTPTKYLTPEKIQGMEDICQISGDLALKNNGKLCAFPDRLVIQPEKHYLIDILSNIVQIGNISRAYTVMLKKDSTVWAWGKNHTGILGNGTLEDSEVPVKVNCREPITAISIEGSRCLALKNDDTVLFWGLVFTDLDNNITIRETQPVKIEGLDNIKMIHASPVWDLLFMKNDGSYWSYNIRTKEIKSIQL